MEEAVSRWSSVGVLAVDAALSINMHSFLAEPYFDPRSP